MKPPPKMYKKRLMLLLHGLSDSSLQRPAMLPVPSTGAWPCLKVPAVLSSLYLSMALINLVASRRKSLYQWTILYLKPFKARSPSSFIPKILFWILLSGLGICRPFTRGCFLPSFQPFQALPLCPLSHLSSVCSILLPSLGNTTLTLPHPTAPWEMCSIKSPQPLT